MNYSSTQGLASLGRNGDSMLVHMSPEEVQGLQGLAMAQGGSLTINPDTGLPEAFKIKNLLKAALPIAAGFMFPNFGPAMFGGALKSGITAGALTGAGIAALSGENPFLGALTGGLGGYGGAGLAGSAAKIGAGAKAATTAEANLINQGIGTTGLPTGGGFSAGTTGADLAYNAQMMAPKISPVVDAAVNTGLTAQGTFPSSLVSSTQPLQTAGALQTAGENFSTLLKNPLDVIKDYGYGSSAVLAGGPLIAGLEPSDLGYGTGNLYNDPDKNKYRGPQGQLNLSDKFDTGLRLAAEGGYIDSYATGGSIQSGGIRDLYGTPDNTPTISTGLGGFGLGRLNNLAGEQAMTQAQTLGYADGGYLDGQGDGMSDSIPATIEGKQEARLADGEFVIPADVVSHLGNGSSKAGSKRLYAMLDKVRSARTGNKKQGKQIKAEKYLPA